MITFTLRDGRLVGLIGDPHLGRKFETGVPLHRRGERELSQSVQFAAEHHCGADIIIQVGDLFDHPEVPRSVVLAAAQACLTAAENNPDTLIIEMAGNHDQPRNLSTVGAWPLFKKMVENRFPNLLVVDRPCVVEGIALFPWEWNRTALSQLEDVAGEKAEHAVGHWDLTVFDGKDDHLVPARALRDMFGDQLQIWSGHYHVPAVYEVDGVPVTCTGSMQPYSHGEDPEGKLYVTLTRAEALERDDLSDKCVRIILAPGEELPEIDCLALTHKREQQEKDQTTVSYDDFDFATLVAERIKDRDPVVRTFIEERMQLNVTSSEEQH